MRAAHPQSRTWRSGSELTLLSKLHDSGVEAPLRTQVVTRFCAWRVRVRGGRDASYTPLGEVAADEDT